MSFFDFFSGKKINKNITNLKTNHTDDFADRISVELKTAAVEAITEVLEQKEGKYLKNILETSFFPLQSLVFVPSDFETAKSVEEFIRVHQAIDSNFRVKFFHSILQNEYRSSRGGAVRVSKDFSSEIQLDKKSIEKRSEEESFQISLRGRKILFHANASLGVPVSKNAPLSSEILNEINKNKIKKIKLLITDSDGHREVVESIPVMIGRNPDNKCIDNGVTPILINSKFVSRSQMYIFSMVNQIVCFVPESASLTCSTLSGKKLVPGEIYVINPTNGERFYFGVPLDHEGPLTGNTDPSEFPIIEINFEKNQILSSGTPRPKISL